MAFFVDIEADNSARPALEAILSEMALLAFQFASHFIYVKGFELYTAQRIRRGILDKIWGDMVELYDAETKLFQMVEK